MDTKKIADFIEFQQRLQFDKKSNYMEQTGFGKQRYAEIIKKLNKKDSRISFNLINKMLQPLGYKLDIVKIRT